MLTARWGDRGSHTIAASLASGGYEALRKALATPPAAVTEMVKVAGLRGRGGAGFPTGVKWGFIKRDEPPTYLVCNADEGEPGTFKDRELMERDPHQLIEGMVIASWAIGAAESYVYCRGEFAFAARRVERAISEAYERGTLGRNIFGSGFDHDVILHRGAGAYICGEETALLESLEGRRGQPRVRPPFPAQEGLYARPTVINNVETISCVPHIVANGPEWFRKFGTEKSPGTKIFSVSGDVERPGNYEVPFGTPARVLIEELAGGITGGRKLKAYTPGGASSTPVFGASKLDVNMDWESVQAAGSLLGTGAMMVFADDACVVRAMERFMRFYARESCGKCTPCREGTYWLAQIMRRLEAGQGRDEDLDLMMDVQANIGGRSFCALGDFATAPVISVAKEFVDEARLHIRNKGCPFER
ncbi:MAG: NADH-quinone oxidoreductase subunit NuoF [Acidobacteria bacterium]|nr:NADH-quinone oxidoreductase subunit NuoF [Acidobacteriota bacterium]